MPDSLHCARSLSPNNAAVHGRPAGPPRSTAIQGAMSASTEKRSAANAEDERVDDFRSTSGARRRNDNPLRFTCDARRNLGTREIGRPQCGARHPTRGIDREPQFERTVRTISTGEGRQNASLELALNSPQTRRHFPLREAFVRACRRETHLRTTGLPKPWDRAQTNSSRIGRRRPSVDRSGLSDAIRTEPLRCCGPRVRRLRPRRSDVGRSVVRAWVSRAGYQGHPHQHRSRSAHTEHGYRFTCFERRSKPPSRLTARHAARTSDSVSASSKVQGGRPRTAASTAPRSRRSAEAARGRARRRTSAR